jgi:hypothetical protein
VVLVSRNHSRLSAARAAAAERKPWRRSGITTVDDIR